MSIAALEHLYNGRDTIVAMVCEHHLLNNEELKDIDVGKGKEPEHCANGCNIITHGLWCFCYHRDVNVVYLL